MAMIRARVRVDNENDSFTILVCAESLRNAERTAKTRYPECTVRIAFPLEPEHFFVDGPHTGGRADLVTAGDLIGTPRPA
jgi:hypothetical protein